MNYQLKYDFGNYNSSVVSFIESIYKNSLKLLNDAMISDDNYSSYKDIIIKSIGYLEDYLFYMYSFNNEVFFQIFNNLMSKLKVISILPADKSYKYGDCDLNNGIIYINPSVQSTNGLDYDSRIRLNLCHNLGHITNDIWMKSAKDNLTNMVDDNKFYKISCRYGLRFIDEAISQNHAENITYYFLGKDRPVKKSRRSSLFGSVLTNFDYYEELQEQITAFALFFVEPGRSIGSNEAVNILSKMALKSDFIETIFNLLRRKHLSFRHKWSTQLQAFTLSCSRQECDTTIFSFFHLFSPGLLRHVESSSLTRDGSQPPWIGSEES